MKTKLLKSALFLLTMVTLCSTLKWMYNHITPIRNQHMVITEKSIDVRALFYTESEVGINALIDIREPK